MQRPASEEGDEVMRPQGPGRGSEECARAVRQCCVCWRQATRGVLAPASAALGESRALVP